MKTNKIIAMSLLAALAAGCSSDDIVKPDNGQGDLDLNGQAYVGLSISLPSVSGTRSANDKFDMGTTDEYKVNDLTVRYLDANGIEQATFTYKAEQLVWSTPPEASGITTKAILPVEKVPFSGTAYALVEINNPFGSSIAANPTVQVIGNEQTNKDAEKILIGENKDEFFMTNTVWKDGHYLVPVKTAATEDYAKYLAANHTVYVERAAAKVQLGVGQTNWNGNTYTIPAEATNGGASIDIKSWVLDVTNKKMFPIRKFRGNIGYENGGLPETDFPRFYSWANANFRTYWAEDPNYSEYVPNDFYVISTYPENPNALNDVEYCAENTFNVPNQCQNQTTRVLIQAKYTPKEFDKGSTWYTIGNSSSPLTKESVEGMILKAAQAVKKCDQAKLQEEQISAGTADFTNAMFTIDGQSPSDAVVNRVKADLGKITAYKNGICYYVVRIKHFGNEICPWGDERNTYLESGKQNGVSGILYDEYAKNYYGNAIEYDKAYLGRYGVVRNNWYKVSITAISQPGSPVIPELSAEQDDEHYNYLQSTIEILDWAVREQGEIL